MSPHPELDSARVKLERAQEHMERLKTEQEAWARTHPQPFDFKLVDDPDPTKILAVVDHLDQPPGFLSALLGDVVHNLRSALDHVSWLLVRHGTTAQLSSRDERQVQFPIYDTRDAYDANRGRRLPGIRDVHDAIVRRHQPFQRAAKPEAHPLAVLRDLSNVDKHQNIHLTFWCASKATFTVTSQPPGCRITQMTGLLDLNDPLEPGTPLFSVSVASERSLCKGMQVESRFMYQAALEDGRWVYDTTRPIERMVAGLIDEIDRVL